MVRGALEGAWRWDLSFVLLVTVSHESTFFLARDASGAPAAGR